MISLLTAVAICQQQTAPPLVGDTVEPFAMPSLEGPVVAWSPGKPTIVCAFAYWCDTWKTQSERLAETRRKLPNKDFEYLAVSVDGQWTKVDNKAPWATRLTDVGSRWSRSKGIDRVPYTFVVDATGTIVWSAYGIARSDDMAAALRKAALAKPNPDGTLYLTFDDFPSRVDSSPILDALRKSDVKATFFTIGENAAANPKDVWRAIADGHSVQVHAWRHTETDSDPDRCKAWLTQTFAIEPKWVRRVGSNAIVGFDQTAFPGKAIDPYDYLRPGINELRRRTIPRLRDGAAIQLHVGVAETAEFVPELVKRAQALGYRFDVLR